MRTINLTLPFLITPLELKKKKKNHSQRQRERLGKIQFILNVLIVQNELTLHKCIFSSII